MRQLIISHDMVFLLNKILMIVSMGKVIMSFSGDFCLFTLMITIVMKSNSLWSLSFA